MKIQKKEVPEGKKTPEESFSVHTGYPKNYKSLNVVPPKSNSRLYHIILAGLISNPKKGS